MCLLADAQAVNLNFPPSVFPSSFLVFVLLRMPAYLNVILRRILLVVRLCRRTLRRPYRLSSDKRGDLPIVSGLDLIVARF